MIPPKDGFGTSGNSTEGIGASDTLVFVIDIGSTFATGSVPGTQATDAGGSLPTVTGSFHGDEQACTASTIKIPAKTNRAERPCGGLHPDQGQGGPKVAKGEDIAVQYTGVIWRTGKVFDSSWARSTPLTTVIGEARSSLAGTPALVGQTVGSRVLPRHVRRTPMATASAWMLTPRRASTAPTPWSSSSTSSPPPSRHCGRAGTVV